MKIFSNKMFNTSKRGSKIIKLSKFKIRIIYPITNIYHNNNNNKKMTYY